MEVFLQYMSENEYIMQNMMSRADGHPDRQEKDWQKDIQKKSNIFVWFTVLDIQKTSNITNITLGLQTDYIEV